MRRSRLVVALAVAVTAAAGVLLPTRREHRHAVRPPTLAEPAAHNYRVLTPAQSKVLVRYAARVHECVAARDTRVGPAVASRTRIVMRAPGLSARRLLRLLMACDATVGPPPPRSSLQARADMILVYLPKRCLLDPARVGRASA